MSSARKIQTKATEDPPEYQEDRQHLEGLLPDVAAGVDLVLLVESEEHRVGLPVHAALMSAHSPVLGQLLLELRETGSKQHKQQTACLPMTDDSYAAVVAALKCIYGSFPRQDELPQSSKKYSYSAPKVDLAKAEASLCAQDMLLSHKYGMTKVLESQAEAFMEPLREAVLSKIIGYLNKYEPYCDQVLDCIAVAQTCECYAMSALCEAFIIRFYRCFLTKQDVLLAKLPKESMLQIMLGFYHHSPDIGVSQVKRIVERLASQHETPAERLGM